MNTDAHHQPLAQATDPAKPIRIWLYLVCLLIFAMVIVGGATRLTDSGLSITEWKPLLGAIPPLSAAGWEEAFQKYQQIPQFKTLNSDMDLAAFKAIYWWEWAHRLLGRLIGVFFFLPMVWFWLTGRLNAKLKLHLSLLFLAGALQGVIGWWMVKSGLTERVDVSQYRLAVHLSLAFLIFAGCLWVARGLARHTPQHLPASVVTLAPIVALLIFFQIFLGALVAGTDAGFAYNDWPLMDGAVVPQGLGILEPFWKNFLENPKTIQFVHRIGAYIVIAAVLVQLGLALSVSLGGPAMRRIILITFLVAVQTAIGILTLIWQVPLLWALMHQAGAVILFAFAIVHWRANQIAAELA